MEAIVTTPDGRSTRQTMDMGGSELVPVPTYPAPGGTNRVAPKLEEPVKFNEDMLNNSISAQSEARREARAARPDASMLATAGAAIELWDTKRIFNRIARPSFSDDSKDFSQVEYLDHIGMVLAADERDYFMEVGKGPTSAEYAMNQIQNRRTAYDAFGDHEVVGTLVSMGDLPGLIAPFPIRLARLGAVAGRVASAAGGAAIAGGISLAGEGPLSDEELALNMLANGAAAAMMYKPGKGMVQTDATYPAAKLDEVVEGVRVGKTDVEGLAPDLQPGAVNRVDVPGAVEAALVKDSEKRGLGSKLMWNTHKTMASFGVGGKKVADLLFDNNSDLTKHSMESHRATVLTDLMGTQLEVFDMVRGTLKERGVSQMDTIFSPRKSAMAQAKIEEDLAMELWTREQLGRQGIVPPVNADPRIAALADKVDDLHRRALREKKAAGVEGAEQVDEKSGYFHRIWSSFQMEQALDKLVAKGHTREASMLKLNRLVAGSLRRANGWDKELANEISSAITSRALNKGQFEDSLFNGTLSNGQLEQLRQVMREGGMTEERAQNALNRIRIQQDDAGKVGYLKHRVDLDYKATLREGDVEIKITDLLDKRMTGILDRYTKSVATESAFARVGVKSQSDIDKLRKELMESTPHAQRAEAARLFDDSIDFYKGNPSGARMNDTMRLVRDYGRMISLTWGGLWQATEFASAGAEYGMGQMLKYAMKDIAGFKAVRSELSNPEDARSLHNVLTNHSEANLRIRPFMHRYEDGYDVDTNSALQLSSQSAGQLVPYFNGMKYVHSMQARVVTNLVIDRLDKAGRGNLKAQEALSKYGLKLHVLERVTDNIKRHGYNVDSWDDALWNEVRPAFGKMMDEGVLHARLGDVPAFVMFDNLGKFLWTYRNFVLSAHNKLFAGGLERNGAGAVGLMLMYQMPLAYLAVEAQAAITGKDLSQDKLTAKALGQMGGFGLFSEPIRWATGDSNEFGSPGLIPVDRGIRLLQDPSVSNAMNMVPLARAMPLFAGLQQQMKDD